jgi:hypothetical protein
MYVGTPLDPASVSRPAECGRDHDRQLGRTAVFGRSLATA